MQQKPNQKIIPKDILLIQNKTAILVAGREPPYRSM